METINSYLDLMFDRFPANREVLQAKEELSQLMEDKYSELIAAGLSQQSAIGQVIEEFGDINELAVALNLDQATGDGITVSHAEADQFLSNQSQKGYAIAFGIAAIIMSAAPVAAVSELTGAALISPIFEALATITMFLLVAFAVFLLITAEKDKPQFQLYKHHQLVLSPPLKETLIQEYGEFKKDYKIRLALAVVLIIVSVVPLIITSEVMRGDAVLLSISLMLMFSFVACGTAVIIHQAIKRQAYKFLLNDTVLKKLKCNNNQFFNRFKSLF